MATLEFFYELASPYSYLASTQVDSLAARTGSSLKRIPITLGGLRKHLDTEPPPANQMKHMGQDLTRWARRYRVPMQLPDVLWTPTIQSLRVCVAAELLGPVEGGRAMHALFRGYWVDNQNIGEQPVLEAVLDRAGFDGKAMVARTQDPAIKDGLKANTQLAFDRGMFGVPTLFVGEQMFFGQDRLDFVEEALRAEGHG